MNINIHYILFIICAVSFTTTYSDNSFCEDKKSKIILLEQEKYNKATEFIQELHIFKKECNSHIVFYNQKIDELIQYSLTHKQTRKTYKIETDIFLSILRDRNAIEDDKTDLTKTQSDFVINFLIKYQGNTKVNKLLQTQNDDLGDRLNFYISKTKGNKFNHLYSNFKEKYDSRNSINGKKISYQDFSDSMNVIIGVREIKPALKSLLSTNDYKKILNNNFFNDVQDMDHNIVILTHDSLPYLTDGSFFFNDTKKFFTGRKFSLFKILASSLSMIKSLNIMPVCHTGQIYQGRKSIEMLDNSLFSDILRGRTLANASFYRFNPEKFIKKDLLDENKVDLNLFKETFSRSFNDESEPLIGREIIFDYMRAIRSVLADLIPSIHKKHKALEINEFKNKYKNFIEENKKGICSEVSLKLTISKLIKTNEILKKELNLTEDVLDFSIFLDKRLSTYSPNGLRKFLLENGYITKIDLENSPFAQVFEIVSDKNK